jgi:hypothetical protein
LRQFVKPFPSGDEVWDISHNGTNKRWSGDGRRLFFAQDADAREVDIQTEGRFRAGVPRRLFSLTPIGSSTVLPGFDVSRDGQRFLLIETDRAAAPQSVVVVLDFAPQR